MTLEVSSVFPLFTRKIQTYVLYNIGHLKPKLSFCDIFLYAFRIALTTVQMIKLSLKFVCSTQLRALQWGFFCQTTFSQWSIDTNNISWKNLTFDLCFFIRVCYHKCYVPVHLTHFFSERRTERICLQLCVRWSRTVQSVHFRSAQSCMTCINHRTVGQIIVHCNPRAYKTSKMAARGCNTTWSK